MKSFWGLVVLGTSMMVGCATAPPRALVEARTACAQAAANPDVDPNALRDAHRALSDAEYEFEENGDGPQARRAAELAHRRATKAVRPTLLSSNERSLP